MTTPPLSGQPHQPHGAGPVPAPYPPAPPGVRRAVHLALAVALLLALAGGGAVSWWLLYGRDAAPLAGRPRVSDTRAGISYAIPPGWERDRGEDSDPTDAFSSRIAGGTGGGKGSSSVISGRSGQVVPGSELRTYTEAAARSDAELFFPDRTAHLARTRATTVSGHPAHTVVLRVPDQGRGGAARLRMTVLTVDSDRTVLLLGLTTDGTRAGARDVDDVLDSAEVR